MASDFSLIFVTQVLIYCYQSGIVSQAVELFAATMEAGYALVASRKIYRSYAGVGVCIQLLLFGGGRKAKICKMGACLLAGVESVSCDQHATSSQARITTGHNPPHVHRALPVPHPAPSQMTAPSQYQLPNRYTSGKIIKTTNQARDEY